MTTPAQQPSTNLLRRIEPFLNGRKFEGWRRADGGYTPAERWILRLDDGTSFFAKAGTNPWTADNLRIEYNVYSQLQAPFMAEKLWWSDDAEMPVLILEDLSAAHWPPPWSPRRIDAVLDALAQLRTMRLDGIEETKALWEAWNAVAADPAPFLSLELCTPDWLERHLPAILKAQESAPWSGTDLAHSDVRSDNICFRPNGKAVLVDWNWTCYCAPDFDIAAWLPSLHAEGGPLPETILPDDHGLAVLIAGYFAAYAGLPSIPNAPRVRTVQLSQLRTALPWAVRTLGLPPVDGRNAPATQA